MTEKGRKNFLFLVNHFPRFALQYYGNQIDQVIILERIRQSREMDMIHGSLGDKIIRFALPVAATGILQQLFNAADIAVIGRFVGKEAMAAVGSNNSLIV